MPQDLRLRIGNEVVTEEIGGTPAQVAAAMKRFMRRLGIPIVDVPTTDMSAFLKHIKDDVKRTSKEVQIAEADATAHATNAAQAESDNPL